MLKIVDTDFPQLKDTTKIEEILCLSVLIADDRLHFSATVKDARDFYARVGNCGNCPVTLRCLACIINA